MHRDAAAAALGSLGAAASAWAIWRRVRRPAVTSLSSRAVPGGLQLPATSTSSPPTATAAAAGAGAGACMRCTRGELYCTEHGPCFDDAADAAAALPPTLLDDATMVAFVRDGFVELGAHPRRRRWPHERAAGAGGSLEPRPCLNAVSPATERAWAAHSHEHRDSAPVPHATAGADPALPAEFHAHVWTQCERLGMADGRNPGNNLLAAVPARRWALPPRPATMAIVAATATVSSPR